MKLLFLSRWFPYPPNNGSKIRIFNLLKHLARQHTVDLISFFETPIAEEHVAELRKYCHTVQVAHYRPFRPNRLRAKLGYFLPKPRSVLDTYNQEFDFLVEQASTEPFDLVIAAQIDMIPYALKLSNTPKLLEELELTTLYEQYSTAMHPLTRLRRGLMWQKMRYYLKNTLSEFAGCTVVSKAERALVQQATNGYNPVGVIPNGVDVAHYQADFGPPEPDTLVYSGALSFYANLDAMAYFIGEILPLIQAERPGVRLAITGRRDENLIKQLPPNEGVLFTGYLDDIRPTITRSWVSIAPLRLGGGTRLKILEALAAGTPVVSTTKGAEGLSLTPEHDLLLADDPSTFAAAVLRLLQDKSLRQTLSQQGRETVKSTYDWAIIGQQLNDFIDTIT